MGVLFLDVGRLLPSGRRGGMISGQQTCGKLTAGLVILPPPLQVLVRQPEFECLPPFGSNYLATDFQPIFDFLTHALIGDYYITNSIVGIISTSVA